MLATGTVGLDVGGLEHREGVLARDGAGAPVCVEDLHSEDTLTQARRAQDGGAKSGAGSLAGHKLRGRRSRALEASSPDPQAFADGEIVSLARLRRAAPITRLRHPLLGREEHRLRDQTAADPPSRGGSNARSLANPRQSRAQLLRPRDAVPFAERLPGEPVRQHSEAGEVAEPSDRVVRRLQLEEERRSDLQAKRSGRWPPEVRIARSGFSAQVLVPTEVGHCDVPVHVRMVPTVGSTCAPGSAPQLAAPR